MQKDEDNTLWNLMVIAVMVVAAPVWAFCFCKIWSWFIVPLGVNQIGLAHAIGISLVAKMIHGSPLQNKNDGWTTRERDGYRMVVAFIWPLFLLGLAALVHSLM